MKTAFIRIAKTTVAAAFMFVAFSVSAFAKPVEVSNYLSRQFAQQFRGASNVSWKTTSTFTSASFMQDSQKVSVFYNAANELIGISKDIQIKQLPKKMQQALSARYGDRTVISAIEFTDAEGVVTYYTQLSKNNQQCILQADDLGAISEFVK